MAATYNPAEPTERDQIRGLLQDTASFDENTGTVRDPRLADETYDSRITRLGAREAAAQLALSIGAHYTQVIQRFAQGSESYEWARNRIEFYENLAERIRKYGIEGAGGGAILRGAMTTGLKDAAFQEATGVWPPTHILD